MNVYKISWVSKGSPHFLIAVAENAGQVSSYVQSLDAANHINEVATLYTDVHVVESQPESKPAAKLAPAVDDAPVRSAVKKK